MEQKLKGAKKKVTKSELIRKISSGNKLRRVEVSLAIDCLFEEIKQSMKDGREVSIKGFGNFMVKKRAPKVGRDLIQNISVSIPERKIPFFKPSQEFKQIIMKEAKDQG